MLPAVSALDCLFADLGIDPGGGGCQTYDADAFLPGGPAVDPEATLLLLQVGMLGESSPAARRPRPLRSCLRARRAAPELREQEAVLYEASTYPGPAGDRPLPAGRPGAADARS